MPAERITMRQIREVLRLAYELQLSERQIATSCNVSKTTVLRYLRRAKGNNLSWPLPPALGDDDLERLLFPSEPRLRCKVPNWGKVNMELKRKGVTKLLLWEEYRAAEPNGLSYSRYCFLYRTFVASLDTVMRQTHVAGEKLFVDYAGHTISWIDQATGEVHQAQIFVAVLGASNYTFCEATRTQSLPDWIGSHVRAFSFFGGAPKIVVPDNLKSGVTKAHHYDPEINTAYQEMANHYGVAVVPARSRKPKDKAKVEVGVQGVERRILAKLRDRQFFSVAEINLVIKDLLEEYNARLFQKISGSRRSLFQSLDKPALSPLPNTRYEYAQWKKVRVGLDYHLAFEQHYYSVPHRYKREELDLRITPSSIEFFYKSKAIAVHRRAYKKGHTTIKEHMPKQHQSYAEWTPERLIRWAEKTGEQTAQLIQRMIESRPQPQQAFRACIGVMRLGKSYGDDRLEKAAARANLLGALSYSSIASILKKGLDQKPLPETNTDEVIIIPTHNNIRGSGYYH